jgi:hypothetical protein
MYSPQDYTIKAKQDFATIARYLPDILEIVYHRPEYDADKLRILNARHLVRNFDALFKLSEWKHRFNQVGKAAGLEWKDNSTIIGKWPMRLSDNATKEEFQILQARGHTGCERYMEWRRVA